MNKTNINIEKYKYVRDSLKEYDWNISKNILIIKCISNGLCIKTDIDTFFIEANEFLVLHNNIPFTCFTNLDSCEFEVVELPAQEQQNKVSSDDENIIPNLIDKKLPYAFKLDNSNTAKREISLLLNEAIDSIKSTYEIDYILGISSIYKALYHSINYYNGKKFTSYSSKNVNENLNLMLSYIDDNYISNISLSNIYERCDLGERQCLRLFSDILGISPNQLIIIKRMVKSEELLSSHKQYTIKEIGELSGFKSPSYFNKTFKKIFGCTPKTYREGDAIIKQPNDPMAALLNFFD